VSSLCLDCNLPHFEYMVHDDLWSSMGLGPRNRVCLPCFEARLGREITYEDITLAPVNFLLVLSRFTRKRAHFAVNCRLPGPAVFTANYFKR
jgi:hypothetical protein